MRVPVPARVKVRTCKCLNNIVQHDHRTMERRCASLVGSKSLATVGSTSAGIELTHRVRKGQSFRLRIGAGATAVPES